MKKLLLLAVLIIQNFAFSQLLTESFESNTFPPTNWAFFDNGFSGTPNIDWSTIQFANSGFLAAFMNRQTGFTQSGVSKDFLATPSINIPVNGQLKFYTKTLLLGMQGTTYKIMIKSVASGLQNDPTGYVLLQQWDDSNLVTNFNVYEEKTVNIPLQYTSQNVYLAFCLEQNHIGNSISGNRWLVDDVRVVQQCISPPITALNADNISGTSATLSWNQSGNNTSSYDIELSPATLSFNYFATNISSSNQFNITGLTPGVCYKYQVRSNCGNGDFGDWTGPYSFCTGSVSCPTPTNISVSNVGLNSAIFNWTENGTATQWEYALVPCVNAPNSNQIVWNNMTTNPFVANNLLSATCYSLIIRSICGTNDISTSSSPITFSTLALPPNCGGNFVDNGGVANNYQNNSDEIITLCPNLPNDAVTVTFTAFNTEVNWDVLYVFDGSSINSPMIVSTNPSGNVPGGVPGGYWGTAIPGPFTASSPDGCLTFRFRSDASINNLGWSANVTCNFNNGFSLNAFLDSNSNGTKDSGEINFPMGQFNYELNNSGTINNIFTNNGIVNIQENNTTNIYNFGYTIDPAYSSFYNVNPISFQNVFIGTNNGYVEYNFAIVPVSNLIDLQVSLIPTSQPRAGSIYTNRILFANNGNQTINSGTINFINDAVNSISYTSQTVSNTANGFNYNFTNLLPFESRFIDVVMQIPPIPTVSINQLLTNSVSASTTVSENILTNNDASLTQAIVAAYDPNDKMESHGEKILFSSFDNNEYLNYTIRFENTGNASAIDVRITDVLDAKIDEASVKMIDASHNYYLNRIENNLEWKFDNIQLPPSIANTEIGKGFVTFKAKLKPGFAVGTIVPNMARIYFDTNPAIETNTFNTEFVSVLANVNFNFDNVGIYPNPASKMVQVNLKNTSENILNISINDILGKTVNNLNSINSKQTTLDISDLEKGIYLMEITTENYLRQTKKLIVE